MIRKDGKPLVRRWYWKFTRIPRRTIPRDAVVKGEDILPGLFVCERPKGCGWAFRYLGRDQWRGAYWPAVAGELTHDSRCEWAGYPRTMTTEQLAEEYADCFGKIVYLEPVLQRRWDAP